jgi:hypothetical protein
MMQSRLFRGQGVPSAALPVIMLATYTTWPSWAKSWPAGVRWRRPAGLPDPGDAVRAAELAARPHHRQPRRNLHDLYQLRQTLAEGNVRYRIIETMKWMRFIAVFRGKRQNQPRR